ncbi:MAG TPA: tyrosine-type recombinase/integrase [Puia sp.]|nr:tyrosine-type recombinase/integrase [Puia sp.]
MIQSFIDYLKFEKHYSPHTIRSYEDDLIQFFDYVAVQYREQSLKAITPSVIRSWLASLKDEGSSSRSINRKISSLRSFFKYKMRSGEVEQSPMIAITSPKISKRLPVYVEQQDIATLFAEISFPDSWEGWTDRLLLAVFYHTGIRLSELLHLQERQVDRGNRTIKVLGKGNKERIIPIGPVLMEGIEAYCERKRTELDDPDVQYLFVGKSGKKLYAQYIYRAVKKYLSQVTTVDKKSPHVLRHSFATHLMNEGAELNSVKELLGHASLAATQVYTHNTIEKLKDVYRKAHPKA